MKTRELVTGRYINPKIYVLYYEDGREFQVIREKEPFNIANQLREWIPIRVPNKNGKGTIMVCQKFGNQGNVIEEFPLNHNKKGLWALTSGSARKGVFHRYVEHENELEKTLAQKGVSPRVISRVKTIELELEEGYFNSGFGYSIETDGEKIRAPWQKKPYEHGDRQYVVVSGATYLIYWEIGNSSRVKRIILTPDANEKEVVKKI